MSFKIRYRHNILIYMVFTIQLTLFTIDRGHVFACGSNVFGQLGLGHQSATISSPTKVSHVEYIYSCR